ncbi:MAG: hypothetical protein V4655_10275 [Bdellovibrionota bacterium]
MKILINAFDILGAVFSSKMTGDLRSHYKWILFVFFTALVSSYLVVRP